MLAVMAAVLLVITFFIWAGVPFFIIGSTVAELTSNLAIIHLSISFSGGLLFSLYFVPINLKVAKKIADLKQRSVMHYFIRIELMGVLLCSSIFQIILSILIQL